MRMREHASFSRAFGAFTPFGDTIIALFGAIVGVMLGSPIVRTLTAHPYGLGAALLAAALGAVIFLLFANLIHIAVGSRW